jgi:NIMA (never in mitosis gene a)-related kinase
MNGLYKRVLKGAYPEIPKKYTKDLADVIMRMLSVEPRLRPNCQQILDMDQIKKRYHKLFPNESSTDVTRGDEVFGRQSSEVVDELNKFDLLNTIKVPQNLAQLTKRLPKANYSLSKSGAHSSSVKKRELSAYPQPQIQMTASGVHRDELNVEPLISDPRYNRN